MKLFIVVLMVFVVLLVGCEPEPGQISGTVTGFGERYRDEFSVGFGTSFETLGTTGINRNGQYSFENVPTDEDLMVWISNVSRDVYETRKISLEPGEAKVVDFSVHVVSGSAGKPNIYLYPAEETEVSVSLKFAGEGYITTTIPDYGDGWNVTITPDGRIDDEYDFLFYEGVVDAEAQHTHGWLIVQEELESFFRVNLTAYGFRGQEIEDFVEFWVPRLTDKPMYVIYPQLNEDYDNLVALTVEPKPDHVLRLAYTIRGVDIFDGRLLAPEMPTASFIVPQEREGFWVTEWGVLLTDEDFKQYIH